MINEKGYEVFTRSPSAEVEIFTFTGRTSALPAILISTTKVVISFLISKQNRRIGIKYRRIGKSVHRPTSEFPRGSPFFPWTSDVLPYWSVQHPGSHRHIDAPSFGHILGTWKGRGRPRRATATHNERRGQGGMGGWSWNPPIRGRTASAIYYPLIFRNLSIDHVVSPSVPMSHRFASALHAYGNMISIQTQH